MGTLLSLFGAAPETVSVALAEHQTLNDTVLGYLQAKEWTVVASDASLHTLKVLSAVPHFLSAVSAAYEKKKKTESSGMGRVSSAELCSICYAAAMDTRFDPCGHTSCADCIQRHLLNSKRCFFCNADITGTTKM